MEEGICLDTTSVDYACPHHSIGGVMPAKKKCDDDQTDRDE
jgi:hypothetical protein